MMLLRRPSRTLAVAASFAVIFTVYMFRSTHVTYTDGLAVGTAFLTSKLEFHSSSQSESEQAMSQLQTFQPTPQLPKLQPDLATEFNTAEDEQIRLFDDITTIQHRVLFSTSTQDRQYMRVYLGGVDGNNVNIIPHPTDIGLWILVAQNHQAEIVPTAEDEAPLIKLGLKPPSPMLSPSTQLMCTAGIQNDNVICAAKAVPVPFGPQLKGNCSGRFLIAQYVLGSRDSRVFYGPEGPYIVYGAQSNHICFGQWVQDARSVLFQFKPDRHMHEDTSPFKEAIEIIRPSGGQTMEKNYFLFWDSNNVTHVHYDLWPKRAFSKLNSDGKGSEDLAVASDYRDQICMAKFMPSIKIGPYEAIHQGTNSLSITLCKRSDPTCHANDSNTFIMHIFQHKSYYQNHATYEPYIVLFQRHAPFAIHAIGTQPFWIHGRKNLTAASESMWYKDTDRLFPEGHTEMFYITSMNWKSHTSRYHGYADDVLFISFGIEDTRPGIIDILAGDLFDDLAYC